MSRIFGDAVQFDNWKQENLVLSVHTFLFRGVLRDSGSVGRSSVVLTLGMA
jgi:hypothetical protein